MNQALVSSQLRFARFARNLLALLLAMSIVANAALAIHISRQTNSVILVPSVVSDGMVARGSLDVAYLEQLAKDAVMSLYQLTPTTLGEGRAVIERVSSGETRSELLGHFDAIAKDIGSRKLSTVWRTVRLTTNLDALTVDVEGEFSTYVRNNFASSESRTIRVTFGPEGASAWVIGIESLEE